MTSDIDVGTVVAVGGYLCLVALIAYYGYSRTVDEADFLVAGREVGPIVGAGTLLASQISASTVIGAVGIHYLFGLGFIWVWVGILVGWLVALAFVLFAPGYAVVSPSIVGIEGDPYRVVRRQTLPSCRLRFVGANRPAPGTEILV